KEYGLPGITLEDVIELSGFPLNKVAKRHGLLPAPVNLRATINKTVHASNESVQSPAFHIAWNKVPGAKCYIIEVAHKEQGGVANKGFITLRCTVIIDCLSEGEEYEIKVTALN